MPAAPADDPKARLARLLGYLAHDPYNLTLLADTAEAAHAARDFAKARALLDRHRALAPLPPRLVHLEGLIALSEGDGTRAAQAFEALIAAEGDAPVLRYNLAYARALASDHEGALALLDDDALDAAPRASALKIELLQHLERHEDAQTLGAELARRFPDNAPLMGTLATLALDMEDADGARAYALLAPERPESLTVLGSLSLADGHLQEAQSLFGQALQQRPDNPRALIGRGLAALAGGDAAGGAEVLGRGAERFGDHLGSWVAAGWASFLAGRSDEARQRFEHVIALDGSFAEGHGGLAAVLCASGQLDEARHAAGRAARLDRQSLGAALANMLLAEAVDDQPTADQIRTRALSQRIGPDGQTLAQALARFATNRR